MQSESDFSDRSEAESKQPGPESNLLHGKPAIKILRDSYS